MRSAKSPASACCKSSTTSRSAPTCFITSIAMARKSGAKPAASMPATTRRTSRYIDAAWKRRPGPEPIHPGGRLGAFSQDEGGVTAYFFDRSGAHTRTVRAYILIGADGIHSRVRETLFPDEGPPCWNGLMLWRGARDWPVFLTGKSMIVAGGLNAKVGVYPLAEGSG